MYVQPDNNVIILHNCPLDTTYDHTIFFNSLSDQYSYFNGLAKYRLTKQTYQRVNRGTMRVQIKADDLYDCNYLMFQNSNFGSKWFYAFIRSVEYVNNITAQISYVIDVMQTWHFDYTLGECYVSREHSATDVIGENTIPEGLEQGPYIQNSYDVIPYAEQNIFAEYIVFVTTFNNDEDLSDFSGGGWTSGVYSGLQYIAFLSRDISAANAYVSKIIEKNKWDGVVACYMSPFPPDSSPRSTFVTVPKYQDNLGGYVPKNKKLLTSPYNLMHVTSPVGDIDFAYELWNGDCTFNVQTAIAPEPAVCVRPQSYGTLTVDDRSDMKLDITGFPQCAIVADTYKAYLAYNAASLPTKLVGMSASAGASLLTAGANVAINAGKVAATGGLGIGRLIGSAAEFGETLVNSAAQIGNEIAQLHDISTRPPMAAGAQTASADYAFQAMNVYARHYTIKPEYARIIDDYFTMYGYATHRTKVPNRDVRPHWTYTQTMGCVVHGSVPCDDMHTICNIYNNGITFWKNGAEIGNYSLDNSV